MKALDFSWALKAPDPAAALRSLTEAYIFERDILTVCKTRRMDRVVNAIADGKIDVDDSLLGSVQYLIFESAEADLRAQLSMMQRVDTAWKLRSLHHMATGLKQLHSSGIAHQDLKPSNVLVFAGKTSKISDMGCASIRGGTAPRDNLSFAGDPAYAPPESLYGFMDPEWNQRRLGCDAYLLGSIVVFLFAGLSATGLLFSKLPENHRAPKWTGSYGEVLPYVRDAFGKAVETFRSQVEDGALRNELATIVTQLCEPDPDLRGYPLNRLTLPITLSLERYVTRFDLLARRAEARFFKH